MLEKKNRLACLLLKTQNSPEKLNQPSCWLLTSSGLPGQFDSFYEDQGSLLTETFCRGVCQLATASNYKSNTNLTD